MIEILDMHRLPLWDRLKTRRTPLTFDIEITARCNLNCAHCYINLPAGDMEARSRELATEEILSIGRQAASMGRSGA